MRNTRLQNIILIFNSICIRCWLHAISNSQTFWAHAIPKSWMEIVIHFLVELQKDKFERRLGKKSVTSRPSVCSLSTYNFETDQVVNGVWWYLHDFCIIVLKCKSRRNWVILMISRLYGNWVTYHATIRETR